jgi:uncharacterized phage-associated protein
MSRIQFRFDPDKLVQAIAYFASRGVPELTKMKVAKLLFHADKYHLLKYGRPVIGDQYVCMEYGPVPSTSLNVMNDAIAKDPESPPLAEEQFEEFVGVRKMFRGKHPIFTARREPDLDVFSESDLEALDHALAEHGQKSPGRLSRESHDEPCWKIANEHRAPGSRVIMDYRLFFEGQPQARDMLRLVEAQQDDRDAADELALLRQA